MEVISTQGAYKEIRLLWIGLVRHLIHCMEMTSSFARSFRAALLVSFAKNILMWLYQPSDDRYGLDLFRRASLQHDQDAWDWLQHYYSESVLNWIHRHPRRELAYRFDSEKNYIAQAFARFWFATAHNQKLGFNTLSAALQYLRMCLNGAIISTLRAYSRPVEIPLPEPGSSEEESFVEDTIGSGELWKQLQSMLPNEGEQ